MFKLFKPKTDPSLEMTSVNVEDNIILNAGNEIYNVIEYNNMYFSKTSFVAKGYVCDNGIVLVIPALGDLQTNEEEQRRLVAAIKEVKSIIKLHLYVFPVFMTEYSFYFGRPLGDKLTQIREIPDISLFMNNLLYGINERALEIQEVDDTYFNEDLTEDAYYNMEKTPDDEYFCIRKNLDEDAIRVVDAICSAFEDNVRPTDTYRVDVDGQEWVCRDKPVSIKGYDTGLVNGKEWYKITQDFDTEAMSLLTMLFGWTGIHWLYLGKKRKALLYFLTGGCLGVMPFVDMLQMAMGTFTYTVVDYESVSTTVRNKQKSIWSKEAETIYFRKPKKWYITLLMSFVCLGIGLAIGCTLYMWLYEMIGIVNGNTATSVGNFLKDSGVLDRYFQ